MDFAGLDKWVDGMGVRGYGYGSHSHSGDLLDKRKTWCMGPVTEMLLLRVPG